MRQREWEKMNLIWDYAYLTTVHRLDMQRKEKRLQFNSLCEIVCIKNWLCMSQKRERDRLRQGERARGTERLGEIDCEKVRERKKYWDTERERELAYLTTVSIHRLDIQERLCFNKLCEVVCMKIWLRMRQKRER
jgi:hypothetical protein